MKPLFLLGWSEVNLVPWLHTHCETVGLFRVNRKVLFLLFICKERSNQFFPSCQFPPSLNPQLVWLQLFPFCSAPDPQAPHIQSASISANTDQLRQLTRTGRGPAGSRVHSLLHSWLFCAYCRNVPGKWHLPWPGTLPFSQRHGTDLNQRCRVPSLGKLLKAV